MKQLVCITLTALVMAQAVHAGLIDAAGGTASLFGETSLDTDHSGYTGNGFLGHNNNDNSGFTIASDCAFDSITIRYSADSDNAGLFNLSIQDTGSTLSSTGDSTYFEKTGSWTTWTTKTIELSGESGDYFHFAWADSSTYDGGVNVDYVEFQSIPEPASLGLIALFGGSILFIRRRLMM
jgi:hypothetical protein